MNKTAKKTAVIKSKAVAVDQNELVRN